MADIGPYELIGWVAQTSGGTVWKGRDTLLDRFVAVKQVVATGAAEQLRDEARVLAGLTHPNIVAVLDIVEDGESAWLVEEWVDAASLDAVRAASGRLTPAQAIGVVRGALQGLSYAHGVDVVHGAVAPGHILVDREGESKLIDFGSLGFDRAAVGAGDRSDAAYAGPEVLAGRRPDKQADVFSAAAVLAELLSGGGPPAASGGRSVTLMASLAPVGRTLERALASDPGQRHSDAAELLADLEDAAERSLGAGWLATAGVAGIAAGAVASHSLVSADPIQSVAAEPPPTASAAEVSNQVAPVEPVATQPVEPGAGQGIDQVVPVTDKTVTANIEPASMNSAAGGGGADPTTAAFTSSGGGAGGSGGGGSGIGAIAPARRVPTRALAIGGGVAATVAIIVAAVVLTRGSGSEAAAGDQPGQTTVVATDSAGSSTEPSTSTDPATSASPSSSPSPSASPSGATSSSSVPVTPPAGFTGTYSVTTVVTRALGENVDAQVGDTQTNTWTVTAPCVDLSCPSSVVSSSGRTFEFTWDGTSFNESKEDELECFYSETGQPSGYFVTNRQTIVLTPTIVDGSVVSLAGEATSEQLDPCLNDDGSLQLPPLELVVSSWTVTRQGP